jgi:hypothetical protein
MEPEGSLLYSQEFDNKLYPLIIPASCKISYVTTDTTTECAEEYVFIFY